MNLTPPGTSVHRKARGAFFTPRGVTRHLAEWAIQNSEDRVLEPSAGDGGFLVAAVDRLRELGATVPIVDGVELHRASAQLARDIVRDAGGTARIRNCDFFLTDPCGTYDVAIGNPPYIRFQEFTGEARDRARFAAQAQGVALTGLASAWAAFVVHAAAHLRPGGRLGLVLPAELLSTNYAAPIRRFLLERFNSVELVTFETQIFPDAEADTVLVKASGWMGEPVGVAKLRQTRDASTLEHLDAGTSWATATDPSARWSPLKIQDGTIDAIGSLYPDKFVRLQSLGDTTLGMVTGGNRFFTLSPRTVGEWGIPQRDLIRISPPGSSHLRGLALTDSAMTRLGRAGKATWLLYPRGTPSPQTLTYLDYGVELGIDQAYKCRVREPWWKVPLLKPADLFLTYMNADTARVVTNSAGARHLNSVHGVYLFDEVRELARAVLPVASLNSLTLLGAELVGRSYGGGILKIEPREADRWWMPGVELMREHREELSRLKPRVQRMLQAKNLIGAVKIVDEVILSGTTPDSIDAIRSDHRAFQSRRTTRGKRG